MTSDLYLGIDVGGTAMKFALTDRQGHVSDQGEVPTLPADPAASLRALAETVAVLTGGPGAPRLAAVGLACAGIVNPETGWLGRSPNLPGWENSPLGDVLSTSFDGRPYALANDVNGALYGEFKFGAGQGRKNLVMIALGTGVGGGVMIDGRLVGGAHWGAGEIGHMVLDPDGPDCTCGGRGCLEAYAGSQAILRDARLYTDDSALANLVKELGASLSTADLAKLAESGNSAAGALFAAAGRRLGLAVGNLVNLLDPDQVIIGGGVARAGELILAPCREVVPTLVLAAEAKKVPVVAAELGNLAASLGAAGLAREKELSSR